jgi:hypothetical protein
MIIRYFSDFMKSCITSYNFKYKNLSYSSQYPDEFIYFGPVKVWSEPELN